MYMCMYAIEVYMAPCMHVAVYLAISNGIIHACMQVIVSLQMKFH